MERRQLQRVRVEFLVLLAAGAVWLATTFRALDEATAQANLVERYAAAVASNPHDPDAHFDLARAWRQAGNLDEAIQSYQETVRLAPRRLDAYEALADCYRQFDRPQELTAIWCRAFEMDPDWAWRHLDLVRDCVAAGDNDSRIAWWMQVAALRPDTGWPQVFLAEAYETLQRHAEAQACYEKAGQSDPDIADWLLRQGNRSRQRRNWNEAATFYRRSLKVRPLYAPAHLALGRAHLEMDDVDSALQEYRLLRDADDELAKDLLDLIRRRYETSLDVHQKLARIHLELQDYERAATAYNDILATDPKHVAARVGLAEALANLGRYDDAVRAYRKAILLEPGVARTHLLLGRTYVAQDHYGLALDSLERASELDPNAPEICYELGQFYVRANNPVRATRQYRRLRELDAALAEDLHSQIKDAAERPARAEKIEARIQGFGRLKAIGFDQNGDYMAYFERLKEPVRHGQTVFGFQAHVASDQVKFTKDGITRVAKLAP
ncbi:MAG: tetratricopeptide repeat protein [Planctomycetota bacterium]